MIGRRHLALTCDDVQCKILHRRIENLLHSAGEPMHLVDKQHIPRIQVGQKSGQIPRLFNGRAAGDPQIDSHLIGHNPSQGGLAQTGRAVEQHMIQGFLPALGGLDVNFQILLDLILADVLFKRAGTQRVLHRLVLRGIARLHHAVFIVPAVFQIHLAAIGLHRHGDPSFPVSSFSAAKGLQRQPDQLLRREGAVQPAHCRCRL